MVIGQLMNGETRISIFLFSFFFLYSFKDNECGRHVKVNTILEDESNFSSKRVVEGSFFLLVGPSQIHQLAFVVYILVKYNCTNVSSS